MNVFELAAVTSPIMGAIGGGLGAKAGQSMAVPFGAAVGFGFGVVLIVASLAIVTLLIRAFDLATTKPLNAVQWLASLGAVLVPACSPVAAFAIARLALAHL